MKAIQIRTTGDFDVVQLVDLPTPTPAPGQVLLRVAAIGVNYIENYFRDGRYPAKLPLTLGMEASGTVAALGEGVTGFAVGDRVVSAAVQGAYAEYALVPAAQLIAIPAALDLRQAAAVFLQGLTAHYLAFSTFPLKPGDTALIHAAAGGVGLLLTQLAHTIGARVLATVSTPEKASLARAAGADEVILYTETDFVAETRRLTGGRGVDVVYDSVGKTTFSGSLDCLRPRGLLALFGGSSGAVPPFDPILLNGKGSLYLTRPTLAHYVQTREELELRATDILARVANGSLSVRMEHTYPLADARQALIDIASRRTAGKLLLIP